MDSATLRGRHNRRRHAETLLGSDVNRTPTSTNGGRDWDLISDGVSDYPGGVAAPPVIAVDRDGSDILFTLAPPGGG